MPDSVNGCLAPGQQVFLCTPSNPYLHGAEAVVKELTDYGALVLTKSAATGQFRALREEMTYQPPLGLPDDYPMEAYKGGDTIVTTSRKPSAKEQGYTGDVCMNCGGSRMVRSGSCAMCQDCGSSSGCS